MQSWIFRWPANLLSVGFSQHWFRLHAENYPPKKDLDLMNFVSRLTASALTRFTEIAQPRRQGSQTLHQFTDRTGNSCRYDTLCTCEKFCSVCLLESIQKNFETKTNNN